MLWTSCFRPTCICKIHCTDFENSEQSQITFRKQECIRCSETEQRVQAYYLKQC
jgi:hypothetical protein